MATRNRKIVLVSRPSGEPTQDNFKLLEEEIPTPGHGQLLLRTIYLSLDPYMRGRMNAGPSYAPPVEIGEVMEGRGVCQVIETNLPEYQRGEFVVRANWLARIWAIGWCWRAENRPVVGSHFVRTGRTRDAGPHGVHRPVEYRTTKAWGDAGVGGRVRRGRLGGWTDRPDQRLSRCRHRRRCG